MTAVRIGRVCIRRGARIHLAIDGHTCGAARRAGIGYEVTRADLVALGNLCRRCFTPNRVGRAQQLLTSTPGSKAEGTRRLLATVVQGVMTPEQAADEAVLVASIRATMLASGALTTLDQKVAATVAVAPAVQALPEPSRRRMWATLRDEFAATHHQPAAA